MPSLPKWHRARCVKSEKKNSEIDLESFWQGKYSKMYKDEKMIDLLDDETKSIVIKDANYKVKFIEKLRKQFTTNIQLSELNPDAELEIPPTIDEEQIF